MLRSSTLWSGAVLGGLAFLAGINASRGAPAELPQGMYAVNAVSWRIGNGYCVTTLEMTAIDSQERHVARVFDDLKVRPGTVLEFGTRQVPVQ